MLMLMVITDVDVILMLRSVLMIVILIMIIGFFRYKFSVSHIQQLFAAKHIATTPQLAYNLLIKVMLCMLCDDDNEHDHDHAMIMTTAMTMMICTAGGGIRSETINGRCLQITINR
jgi:hypothetical protein